MSSPYPKKNIIFAPSTDKGTNISIKNRNVTTKYTYLDILNNFLATNTIFAEQFVIYVGMKVYLTRLFVWDEIIYINVVVFLSSYALLFN